MPGVESCQRIQISFDQSSAAEGSVHVLGSDRLIWWLDLPRQTASIGSSSTNRVMRRGILLSSRRSATRGGQRGLVGSLSSGDPTALLGFDPVAGLLPPRRRRRSFDRALSRMPFTRVVSLDHFRRVDRMLIFLEGIDQPPIERIRVCELSGMNLLSEARLRPRGDERDPALGFFLSQGFGRDRLRASPRTRHWDDPGTIVSPRARLLEHHPLVGLRRPSCADVPDMSGSHPLARSCSTSSGVAGPSAY